MLSPSDSWRRCVLLRLRSPMRLLCGCPLCVLYSHAVSRVASLTLGCAGAQSPVGHGPASAFGGPLPLPTAASTASGTQVDIEFGAGLQGQGHGQQAMLSPTQPRAPHVIG